MTIFSLLEKTGPELAASELGWYLRCLGRDIKKNIMRKYVAGRREVKREISDGVYTLLLLPLFLSFGCSISPDECTYGLTPASISTILRLVDIHITELVKEEKGIRLAQSRMIEVTRKIKNVYISFYCEREGGWII